MRVPQFFFCFASSHHLPSMNFFYSFLLLLVVLSGFSEHLQHANVPDFLHTPSYSNSSSAQLGILAPVLPQNEVYGITPPQNEVYRITPPQKEVYRITPPQNEVNRITPPQNEVYSTALPQNEVLRFVLIPSGVFNVVRSSSNVFKTVLTQCGFLKFVPPQNGVFKFIFADCQLSNQIKTVMFKGFKLSSLTLIHAGEKLSWSIRILLERLQHVLNMYTWSLSENHTSVRFRCRLIGLLMKRYLFRKHDFAAYVDRLHHEYQILCFWHLKIFSSDRNNSHTHIREKDSEKSTRFHFYGGGKALLFSYELQPYASADLHEQQYQFLQCIKKDNEHNIGINDGNVLCSVPLDVLIPKLTFKSAKELANLHDMYMPSKILLKNARILLENHKCETCPDLLTVFKPYKVVSNAEYQRTWYQKNREKRAECDRQRTLNPEYQESNNKSSKKYHLSKKDVKFPPAPPSTELCRNIVSAFCDDTSPDVFEEAGCAVCGKLTPICEMEELSEVENVGLLKGDGVTRKARYKSSDPVKELKGSILAPGCSRVCFICIESLDKNKMPLLALANGLWIGEIPDELQNLTYAEQLLIARVRHNRCIVKVSSGMSK